MLSLLPTIRQQYGDGYDAYAGGKLYSYRAGTTTPMTTYQDIDGTIPNTNPIVLDAGGWAPPIYIGATSYKFILKDENDVTVWTQDRVRAPSTGDSEESDTPAGWTSHVRVAGDPAAAFSGEELDMDTYTQARFEVGIVRGSVVVVCGWVVIQNFGGTPRVLEGGALTEEAHGITWGYTLDGAVATLTGAASGSLPNATIQLRRALIP